MITRTITITIEVPKNTPLTHTELEGIRSHIDGDNIFDIINKYSECDRDEVGVSVLVNQPTESSMKVLLYVSTVEEQTITGVGEIVNNNKNELIANFTSTWEGDSIITVDGNGGVMCDGIDAGYFTVVDIPQ